MKLTPFFRWYDLWVGAYWDRRQRALYICPIPMFGVRIDLAPLLQAGDRAVWTETGEEVTVARVFDHAVWIRFDDSDQDGWVPLGELRAVARMEASR